MRVGIIGLGKLGLPVAYAMASRGLEVLGHDPFVGQAPADTSHEQDFAETVEAAGERMRFCSLSDVVANCEVVFVAVQTPHAPRFEGVTPLPEDRSDFDYTFLGRAVEQVVDAASDRDTTVTLAVISTVLPGTMEREIKPLLSDRVKLVYNPSFIAMGTTIRDFLDPEFVLLGGDDGTVEAVYDQVLLRHKFHCPRYSTTIENAELIKVAYNTFIGFKIAFANTLMEVCHKTGCDVDEVTGALKLAHRRLISPAYMDGGMGDGGACHPRDNIALSWLARELDLSYDIFDAAMEAREAQARWLVDLLIEHRDPHRLWGILGVAYKPSSHIVTGSAALLVANLMREAGQEPVLYDPHVSESPLPPSPGTYLVGCKHPEFADLKLPEGSVVIDPFRYIPDQEGVEVVRLGAPAHDGQAGHGRAVYSRAA